MKGRAVSIPVQVHSTPPAPSDFHRPLAASSRWMWLGFGSILAIMAGIGVDVSQSLKSAHERNSALLRSFLERDQALDELQNLMVRSGTIIRDYLAGDPVRSASEKADLQAARDRTRELLNQFAQVGDRADSQESGAFRALRADVEAFWRSLEPVLSWDEETKRRKGDDYRQNAMGPLRAEVLRLSRDITQLNDRQLDAAEQSILAEQESLRARLIAASGLGVVFACAFAVIVSLRVRKLERSAEIQYSNVLRTKDQLRGLAARLENAQEEERRSLSRELHDEVGQSMSAMLVELGRLEAALPKDEAVHGRLASFRTQAETAIGTVRDISLLLRPSMLDDLGLVAALNWLGKEASRRTGLRVHVDAREAADDLPDSVRTCVFRVVQEALNNCAKHAKATTASVVVAQTADRLAVSIQDDGVGFDTASQKGLGLLGMKERAARLGGELELRSGERAGTMLTVRLPLPQRL